MSKAVAVLKRAIDLSFVGALERGSHTREILDNIVWLATKYIVVILGWILVGAWVARYLGPRQLGIFNYAQSLAGLFAPFAALGLDSILVRDIVRSQSVEGQSLGTAFLLRLIGGFATFWLALGAVFLLRPGDRLAQWSVAILAAVVLFRAFDVIDCWFQSRVRSKYAVYAKTTGFVLAALVQVALILARASLLAFVATILLEAALGAVGLVAAYWLNGGSLANWQPRLRRAKQLMAESWVLILSGAAIMIYMRIDQVMIGGMIGDKAVGIYAAAVRLSEAWYFIPVAIVASAFPSIVEARDGPPEAYHRRLQVLFKSLSLLSYAVCIPATLMSGWLVTLLYGERYVQAGPVLAVLLWAGPSVALGVAGEQWKVAERLTRFSFPATALGAVMNVVLNWFWIPRYGPLGAAFATVASYPVAGILACLLFRETRQVGVMMLKALVFVG